MTAQTCSLTPQLVAGLAALSVQLLVPASQPAASRLRRLAMRSVPAPRHAPHLVVVVGCLALVMGVPGLFLALSGAVVLRVWRRGAPQRQSRVAAGRVRRAAPLAFDLLATCIDVGLALPTALRVVAASVAEPLAHPLVIAAAGLERGLTVEEASVSLTADGLGDLAAVRLAAETGGPGLGPSLRSIAAEARAAAGAAARASARRAGVWAVGPLTLCFLPAFVLVGVVPVVVGLLGHLGH